MCSTVCQVVVSIVGRIKTVAAVIIESQACWHLTHCDVLQYCVVWVCRNYAAVDGTATFSCCVCGSDCHWCVVGIINELLQAGQARYARTVSAAISNGRLNSSQVLWVDACQAQQCKLFWRGRCATGCRAGHCGSGICQGLHIVHGVYIGDVFAVDSVPQQA